jgi:omega-amidase
MKEKLRISIIQSDIVWLDRKKNLETYSKSISKITNTDIVFLPEMFDTGFYITPHKLNKNEKNFSIDWMKKTAFEKNISIGGSTIIEENNKFHNRFLFVNSDKSIEFYNKRHLFKHAGELNEFEAGNSNKIVSFDASAGSATQKWKINLLICYDLRFPVWSRNTSDYHILVYVANWPKSRIDQWKALLIARAIENQSYVFGVNRIGTDGNGFNYPGKSLIISPKGEIIYEAKENEEDIYTAELDFDYLMKIRRNFPVLEDREEFKFVNL